MQKRQVRCIASTLHVLEENPTALTTVRLERLNPVTLSCQPVVLAYFVLRHLHQGPLCFRRLSPTARPFLHRAVAVLRSLQLAAEALLYSMPKVLLSAGSGPQVHSDLRLSPRVLLSLALLHLPRQPWDLSKEADSFSMKVRPCASALPAGPAAVLGVRSVALSVLMKMG